MMFNIFVLKYSFLFLSLSIAGYLCLNLFLMSTGILEGKSRGVKAACFLLPLCLAVMGIRRKINSSLLIFLFSLAALAMVCFFGIKYYQYRAYLFQLTIY